MNNYNVKDFNDAFDSGDYDLSLYIAKYLLVHNEPHLGTLSCLSAAEFAAGKTYRDSLISTHNGNVYTYINMIDFLFEKDSHGIALDLCTECMEGKFSQDKNHIQFVLRRLNAATKSGRYSFALRDLENIVNYDYKNINNFKNKFLVKSVGYIVSIKDIKSIIFMESILHSDLLNDAIQDIARYKICELNVYKNNFFDAEATS